MQTCTLDHLMMITIAIFNDHCNNNNNKIVTVANTSIIVISRTFRSSLNCDSPYPLLKIIWKNLYPAQNAANRVRLSLPLPPTPTSKAFPKGEWEGEEMFVE